MTNILLFFVSKRQQSSESWSGVWQCLAFLAQPNTADKCLC